MTEIQEGSKVARGYEARVRLAEDERDSWKASAVEYKRKWKKARENIEWLIAERDQANDRREIKEQLADGLSLSNVRLAAERDALLVILADARFEERDENETPSLVDPPSHALLDRDGTAAPASTETKLGGRSFTIPLNSAESEVSSTDKEARRRANVPGRDTEGEASMRDKCTCDPKTVCKHCKLEKARDEVIATARAVAWGDMDETYADLHKAIRALDRLRR